VKPIVIAAAFSLLAVPALAQMSETTRTTTTTTTVSPAEETQMREYVIHEHHAPIPPPTGFEVTSGAVVPESVELYRFPAERHWNYEYTTFGDRTVLVDPESRKVITVLH
jgi:uncharacterized protein DUF1236